MLLASNSSKKGRFSCRFVQKGETCLGVKQDEVGLQLVPSGNLEDNEVFGFIMDLSDASHCPEPTQGVRA